MIDKARVEQLIAQVRSGESWTRYGVRFVEVADDVESVLADYLALRAIVEALAAIDPDDEEGNCHFCGASMGFYREPDDHPDECAWAKAHVLIGPASQREDGGCDAT